MVHECAELRDRAPVFRDRRDTGRVLAELLEAWVGPKGRLLAIPAGGVPVAVALGEATGLPVGVAVVSKVTLPWNTEAGYGAVAFDGTVNLNRALIAELRRESPEFARFWVEHGVLERAIVVVTSDHGESLGDHGEAELELVGRSLE